MDSSRRGHIIAVGKTDGIYLMLFAVCAIVLVGAVGNLFASSGLTDQAIGNTAPNFQLTCPPPGVNPSTICSYILPTGCMQGAAPNQCTLQNNSAIALLNPASPFTTLLSGDFIGFAKSFFGVYNPGQIQVSATPQFAWSVFGSAGSKYQQGTAYCNVLPNTQTFIKSPISAYVYQCNMHSNITPVWSYWASNPNCTPPQFGLLVPTTSCTSYANVQLHLAPGTVGSPSVNNTMYVMNVNTGGNIFSSSGSTQGAPIYNGGTGYLIMGSTILSNNFNSTYQYEFNVFYIGQTQTGSTSTNAVQVLTLFGAALGAVFLILAGLGIFITSPSFVGTSAGSVGVNNQGTRFAQAAGVGLLIWSPFYSEFSNWLNPAILPNGIWVVATLFFTGSFFLGIFVVALIGEPGNG